MNQEIENRLRNELKLMAVNTSIDAKTFDGDLLENEVLDSYGYIEMLALIEDICGFEISENDQFDERLRTIPSILEFIEEKSNG